MIRIPIDESLNINSRLVNGAANRTHRHWVDIAHRIWPAIPSGLLGVHCGGVGPGFNQRLASPLAGARMPGLKLLPLSVAPPNELDWLPRICSIVTTCAVQVTLGFQEESHVTFGPQDPGACPTASSPKFKL